MNQEEGQYIAYYAMEKVRDPELGAGFYAWWVDDRGNKRKGVLGAKPCLFRQTKDEIRRSMSFLFEGAQEYRGEVVLW